MTGQKVTSFCFRFSGSISFSLAGKGSDDICHFGQLIQFVSTLKSGSPKSNIHLIMSKKRKKKSDF